MERCRIDTKRFSLFLCEAVILKKKTRADAKVTRKLPQFKWVNQGVLYFLKMGYVSAF